MRFLLSGYDAAEVRLGLSVMNEADPARRISAEKRLFVRRMIRQGQMDGEEALCALSPVGIPKTAAEQLMAFAGTVYADWRYDAPTNTIDPEALAAPVNQTVSETMLVSRLASLRYVIVSLPSLPAFGQVRFWLGVVRSHSLPVKSIVHVAYPRFAWNLYEGIIRLRESDNRTISGLRTGEALNESPMDVSDFNLFRRQCLALKDILCTDGDYRFRATDAGFDPWSLAFVPGRSALGRTTRLVWLQRPDPANDTIF